MGADPDRSITGTPIIGVGRTTSDGEDSHVPFVSLAATSSLVDGGAATSSLVDVGAFAGFGCEGFGFGVLECK